jgi:hypothetical protein
MNYVCMRFGCAQEATAPGACPTDGHGTLKPVKNFADYKNTTNQISICNFNPSTRRVAFDVYVDRVKHEIYVVLWIWLKFESGGGTAPAWGDGDKTAFKKYLKAGVSVLDSRATFTDAWGQAYTALFFVEEAWFGTHLTIKARTLIPEATRRLTVDSMPPNNGVSAGTATYSRLPPQPTAGSIPKGVECFLSLPAVREFTVNNTTCIPFVHEFGHMIGLPDEYDHFPPKGMVPLEQTPDDWIWKDKAIFYWVKSLAGHNIDVPAWGQYGDGTRNTVNEHSLMRSVCTAPAGLLPRHFVTVLEALEYGATKSVHLLGDWTVA